MTDKQPAKAEIQEQLRILNLQLEALSKIQDNKWCPPPSYTVDESLKTVQKINNHLNSKEVEVHIPLTQALLKSGF